MEFNMDASANAFVGGALGNAFEKPVFNNEIPINYGGKKLSP